MHIQIRFYVERQGYLKGSPEKVARLACSQLYQKGDKLCYKELIFMLRKVFAGCLFNVSFFSSIWENMREHKSTLKTTQR